MMLQNHLIKGSCDFICRNQSRWATILSSKFGDLRHFGIGDMIVLVRHTILQDDGIKGSYDFGDFLCRNQSFWATILSIQDGTILYIPGKTPSC